MSELNTQTDPPAPALEPGSQPPSLASQTTEPAKTPEASPAPKAEPLTSEAIKFPEGFEVDKASLEKFLPLANELGLSAEAANKLVALQAELAKGGVEAQTQLRDETWAGWQKEIREDKEIGGQALETNLASVSKLIDSHAADPAGLRAALDLTGAGNHPAVVRFFVKVAKELNEASPVSGQPVGAAPRSAAETIYPNQGKA